MAFSILKKSKFRNYFLADIISGFGTGMNFIGANWFILKFTGSSAAVGELLSVTLFSGLLIFPFAGTIADRFNRRNIIFWSNLVRGIIISIVAVTIFTAHFKVSYIYLLAVIGGMGWTVFIPASRGLVQEIVERDDLIKGNSLIEVSLQVGMFLAAAAAGFIYKYFGFGTILVIDALTFFVSNVFLMKIKYKATVAHDAHHSFFMQFANGLKYLLASPIIFGFGIIMFLPFVATMSSNVVLPAYVSDHLGRDAVAFGLADMAYGIGACLSGFIAGHIVLKLSKFKAAIGFFLISIASLIFLSANKFVSGLYIASLFFGLCNSSLRIVMNTAIMEIVPKSYMGRAMSVWMAISMLMQVASAYGVGRFIDATSASLGFVWLAAIMLIGLVFACYFMPRLTSECATSLPDTSDIPAQTNTP